MNRGRDIERLIVKAAGAMADDAIDDAIGEIVDEEFRERMLAARRHIRLADPAELEGIERSRQRERDQEQQDRRREALRTAGALGRCTDEMIAAVVSGRLRPTKALEKVRAWLETSSPCLLVLGTVGVGKTVAACWAIAERGGVWVTAPELARLYGSRWEDSRTSAMKKTIVSSRLLVIDDVGRDLGQNAKPEDKARHTAQMSGALLELLDARQSSETRTLITSNMSRDLIFKTYFDARLQSRMAQMAAVLECPGQDMRRERK